MKFQAGNPNLMQKQATRVNKTTKLGNFTPSLGEKNVEKYVRGDYVPVARHPSVVAAPDLNIWLQPVYMGEKPAYVRPGADDHLKIKSKG
jgi:hypothetical protein